MTDSSNSAQIVTPWGIPRTVGYSLLVMVAFFVVQIATTFILLAVELANDPDLNVDQWSDQVGSNGLVISLATLATTLLCVPLVTYLAARREIDPWAFLRLKSATIRSVVLWSFALLAFVVISDSISIAMGRPVVPEFMTEVYSSVHPALLFVALVLAAPVFEEIFFRGFISGALESGGVSMVAAGVVSSLVWAAIHTQYDLYGIVTVFLLGLLLSAARAQTGSLTPCLAMHGLANLIASGEAAFATSQ